MTPCDLLIRNAREVVTLAGGAPRIGPDLDDAGILSDGAVAVSGADILAVGPEDEVTARFQPVATLDAGGGTVLPGFVDAHTHPVFGATREAEFDMRLHGRTYQEITTAGGGIFSSVRSLRETPTDELTRLVRGRFDRFLAAGTTTIEAKSGYGLNREDELRSLEVLHAVADGHPLEMAATFLGAHQIPKEWADRRLAYLDHLNDEVLPEVKERGLAEAVDIFCDEGVWTVDESRHHLAAAKEQGFSLRVHADELARLGAAELAGELGAASADHLCRIGDEGITALRDAGTTAVLLPGTVQSLGVKAIPPARAMIDAGCIVALATDFNPGTSYVISMPTCIAIACTLMRMTAAEAIAASTLNAAWSLGRADRLGSIEPGKQADLVILDRPSHLFLPYELGESPISMVVKRGEVVFRAAPIEIAEIADSK